MSRLALALQWLGSGCQPNIEVLMEELDFRVGFLKTENYFFKVFFFHQLML